MTMKKLQEQRGEMAPQMAIILMVAVMLLSVALQVHHVYAVLDLTINKTNEAVLSVAAPVTERKCMGVFGKVLVRRDGTDQMIGPVSCPQPM